jgi:hypothetical protein
MAEIDKGKHEMMSGQEIDGLAAVKNKQGAEFVNPGKRTSAAEVAFVNLGIDQPFTSALDGFAFVLGDVGNGAVFEADAASTTGIEGTVGVEVSTP